ICGELIEAGVDKLRKDTREAMFSGIVGPEAANMLESSLKDNRLKGLLERALRGDEIKSESQEIMTDLMFLFYDTIAKSPAKYGKQAETLWDSLPGDCKPVFAKA
ncbi:MAG: hypothetical protein GTN93_07975, partial [Anaerolineae bacterium]|nr:hypothetical protein [Anaerolineae bacterium]